MKRLVKFLLFVYLVTVILFASPFIFFPAIIHSKNNEQTTNNEKLSPLVLRFSSRIEEEIGKHKVLNKNEHLPLLLAIVMQESGGRSEETPDIFQCSESLGLKPNSLSLEESIVQGVAYFASIFKLSVEKEFADVRYTVQSYNFGIGFLYFCCDKNLQNVPFNRSVAEEFSVAQGPGYGDIDYVEHVYRYLNVTPPVGVEGSFKVAPIVSNKIRFLQPYGEYTDGSGKHWGIDIGDEFGSIIVSVDDGVIVSTIGGELEDELQPNGGYGNCVTIKHNNNLYTRYAHLKKSSICVQEGQHVKAGERIGLQGNSGYSFGTHLHFEVRVHEGYIHADTRNPEDFIKINYINR